MCSEFGYQRLISVEKGLIIDNYAFAYLESQETLNLRSISARDVEQ